MQTIPIESLDDPRVDDYRDVRDARLRQAGRFIVEGRLNVRRLFEARRFRVRSLLVTPVALEAVRGWELAEVDRTEVFVASQEVLNGVVGYNMHRGCLAVADRPAGEAVDLSAVEEPGLVVALDGLSDQENVGGVFRNAMAFGVDALLLSPSCCDPFFRKALRVSMGGALRVPHQRAPTWPAELERMAQRGFEIVGLDPEPGAEELSGFRERPGCRGTVLVAGAEGAGLSAEVRGACERRVRIGMMPMVDSLNVATAVAIALHHIREHRAR